jgi:crotonobetainyl-CoA:carnitine CoA-transferase CaiB-like acyl-CoA transferase
VDDLDPTGTPPGETSLAGVSVLDFSSQIAGPYCAKLFADAGADVVKVEPPEGDALRRWSATGADPGGDDGALFTFLNAGKRAVVGSAADPHVAELLAGADLVVEAHGLEGDNGERLEVDSLRASRPALVVVSITPYGLAGPWAARRATEFTLQAESGSLGLRGLIGGEMFQAGGRITEWAAGSYAAVGGLAALLRARATGRGEHVDCSMLETAHLVFANFSETMNRLMQGSPADPEHALLAPSIETPSIEPTADGYVGFTTNSRRQFDDFLRLIGRTDLLGDEELAQVAGRVMRFHEWAPIVHAWTTSRTTAEIIEAASRLRIPVSPVGNGQTVLEHEHVVARGVYVPDARGRLRQPRRPYLIDGAAPPAPRPAPRLGGDGGAGERSDPTRAGDPLPPVTERGGDAALPLAGLRVVDLTAWWAGPAASHLLACLGADVIHVESTGRPDGMRMVGGMMAAHYPQWWDASPHFLHANSNKRGITLDLTDPRARAVLERLVGSCDAVLENFTPRVLAGWGLTWERIRELNPRAVFVRLPAFGLTGPWSDRPGFAQTVEQYSGLAWVTGHTYDQPRIPRGPCDPVAGAHAAFALLVALARRARSGRGHVVEVPLVECALNLAAEQVVEWTAYGNLMQRDGNRSAHAAPQGLYPCAGGQSPTEPWLALSVTTEEQWRALRAALGEPAWAMDSALATREGRRAAHDEIDARLREWTRTRPRSELVDELRALGIPASEVADPARLLQTNPQLRARGFFEAPDHPVVGPMPLPSLPFRYAGVDRWLRAPAPTLGQHNDEVLGDLLGVAADERAALEADGVIGTRPAFGI